MSGQDSQTSRFSEPQESLAGESLREAPTSDRPAEQIWLDASFQRYVRRRRERLGYVRSARRFDTCLRRSRRESEILDGLLHVGRHYGIARIRYHRVDGDGKQIISTDCAGHDACETTRLRMGNIVKTHQACPLEKSDSFWCIILGRPVLFDVDPLFGLALDDSLPPLVDLPVIRLSSGQCEQVLRIKPYRFRIDYPLITRGRVMGKLSCDLDVPELSERLARRLRRFWKLANKVTAPFEGIQADARVVALEQSSRVRDEVQATTHLAQLFDYCVTELPRRFAIQHASIFTVSRDYTGSSRLVLRRTSYGPSRRLEDGFSTPDRKEQGFYDLNPAFAVGLTPWVAIHQRALRLQHLNQDDLLRSQLASIDPTLTWRNRIQDSASHTSFLCVPILVGRRLVGVLRFTEKCQDRGSGYFTEMEERCLLQIATDFIGPKLDDLQYREPQRFFTDKDWQQPMVKALAETMHHGIPPARPADSATDARLVKQIQVNFRLALNHFREAIRSRGDKAAAADKKALVFNHVSSQGRLYQRAADAGAKELLAAGAEETHLEGSLTDTVLRENRVIYIHDLDRIRDQRIKHSFTGPVACVLGCPIFLGSRGRGALVLSSDRLDLVPEVHGLLLHQVSELTSSVLTCKLHDSD
jgi:GAF domain